MEHKSFMHGVSAICLHFFIPFLIMDNVISCVPKHFPFTNIHYFFNSLLYRKRIAFMLERYD